MTIETPDWLDGVSALPGPKYKAIAHCISQAVEGGALKPGDRLPPQRELAWALECTVGTISRAYAEAERRGLLGGEVGRGTYIREEFSTLVPDNRGIAGYWHSPSFEKISLDKADFKGAAPVRQDGPTEDAMDGITNWSPDLGIAARETGPIGLNHDYPPLGVECLETARTMTELSTDPALMEMLSYQPHAGISRHREVGAQWIARRGVAATADSTIVSTGAHNGVLATLSAITRSGDTIAAEALSYPGIKAIAGMLGLKLAPVALDEEGLIPEALDALCRQQKIAALYSVPTLQNPTNAIMSEARRRDIAEVAARHGLQIVEDDIFGMLAQGAPKALSAYLPDELAFYVCSISKTLAPGLRVGYVHSPRRQTAQIAAALRTSSWMASPFTAEIGTRWIESGAADRILDSHFREIETRRAMTLSAFEGFAVSCPPGALHAWINLPSPWRVGELVAEAQNQGVILPPTDSFMVGGGETPHAVRLSYCPPRQRTRLQEALDILMNLLDGTTRVEAAQVL